VAIQVVNFHLLVEGVLVFLVLLVLLVLRVLAQSVGLHLSFFSPQIMMHYYSFHYGML
jgi:hypothetical protein